MVAFNFDSCYNSVHTLDDVSIYILWEAFRVKKVLCLMLTLMMALGAVSALAEDTILIGGLAPLTGGASVYGIAARKAADLYVKEVNAAGGILGKQVKIDWLDDKHDATECVNAYLRLSGTENVAAVLGPVTTAPTLAILDMVVEDGIPMITPTGTGDAITLDPHENIFRACFKDSFQGKVMASFAANSLGAKKVAILYDNTSDYSSGITENFIEAAKGLGLEVVAQEACTEKDSDFKTQLTNIAAKEFDALFVPMYYGPLGLIVQQAHEVGITQPLLGVDGWDGVLGTVEDTSLLDGYYFCNHSAADDDTPSLVAFFEKFQAEYNEFPNTFAALGYDAAAVLLNAIEAAGSTDWEAINAAMRATDFEGITGHIKYDEFGDVVDKAGVINIIKDGELKFYERVTP